MVQLAYSRLCHSDMWVTFSRFPSSTEPGFLHLLPGSVHQFLAYEEGKTRYTESPSTERLSARLSAAVSMYNNDRSNPILDEIQEQTSKFNEQNQDIGDHESP